MAGKAGLGSPVDQGDDGSGRAYPQARLPAPELGDGQLRQSLVHPGFLGLVGVPVDGVLEFVGEDIQVALAGDRDRLDIDVDGLTLVAAGGNLDGILVEGAIVSGCSSDIAVDYSQAGVSIHAGNPFLAKGCGDGWVDVFLEPASGFGESGGIHFDALLHVPVGVGGYQLQHEVGLVRPVRAEVHHPQGFLKARHFSLRFARSGPRDAVGVCAQTQFRDKLEQVPVRRIGERYSKGARGGKEKRYGGLG